MQIPGPHTESIIMGGSQECGPRLFTGCSGNPTVGTLPLETHSTVVLGAPRWEERSDSRRGPWPCDPCPENTPQAPNSLHLSKSSLPFGGDLPKTALAICLPAGNIPWFLCHPQEKGLPPPPPRIGTKTLHEASLSSLVLSPWAQTLQPHCSPRAWCFSLRISAHAVPSAGNAFPFPSPWQTCTPPIKSIWEAGSKVN